MVIVSKVEKAGSVDRRACVIEKASADLEGQIGDGKVTALTAHEDDSFVYLIAAVEGIAAPKEKKIKKRGK